MKTLLLSGADVAAHLPILACIDAVEEAFRALGEGRTSLPGTLSIHADAGNFHIKAGTHRRGGRHYFAAKANGNFPENPEKHGLPTIQGVVLLCDADDGRVLAVMDSIALTAIRTAAATAVAARYLAPNGEVTVGLIGCGVQAAAQLNALRAVASVQRVLVFDRDRARARTFADRHNCEVANDIATAASQSEVVVTCTTSKEFVLFPEHVKPGSFVAGVGVDNETKRELAPSVMARAKVVTDITLQCAQIGDLHHALAAGVMNVDDVHAEIAAIVAGRAAGRESADEIIVFDSTGIGLQDVAAAAAVYEAISAAGVEDEVRTIEF